MQKNGNGTQKYGKSCKIFHQGFECVSIMFPLPTSITIQLIESIEFFCVCVYYVYTYDTLYITVCFRWFGLVYSFCKRSFVVYREKLSFSPNYRKKPNGFLCVVSLVPLCHMHMKYDLIGRFRHVIYV